FLGTARGLSTCARPWQVVAGARRGVFACFWRCAGRGAHVRRYGGELVGRRLCDHVWRKYAYVRLSIAYSQARRPSGLVKLPTRGPRRNVLESHRSPAVSIAFSPLVFAAPARSRRSFPSYWL